MDERVHGIDRDVLTPLVRQALGTVDVEIDRWKIEVVHGGWGGAVGGTAIYRFRGQTRQAVAWSLILKVLYARHGEGEDAPYYWKREYEVYRSGMLEDLPQIGLTTPAIYGLAAFEEGCWIWMEDIQGEKRAWTLEDYGRVAYRLGRFNGAYLTEETVVPDYAWLNFNWHCRIHEGLGDTFVGLDAALEHRLVQRGLPIAARDTIMGIWDKVERYCEALEGLPQTLCHIDAFRRNVFLRENDEVVLIDWAVVGRGAIGEDLTSLVAVTLYLNEVGMTEAEALEEVVFEGYVKGLWDAGWDGSREMVRLGYTCAMVLRGLAGVKQDIGVLMDDDNGERLQRELGLEQIEDVADWLAVVRGFRLIRMADEARRLMG